MHKGRQKGTPNKRTQTLMGQLASLEFDVVKELVENLRQPEMDVNERARVIVKMWDFIYPKRKAIDLGNDDSTKETLTDVLKALAENKSDVQK